MPDSFYVRVVRNELPIPEPVTQEWIAKALHIKIMVLTGAAVHGSEAARVYGDGSHVETVWLLNHPTMDGAGSSAQHFSLISKEFCLK